MEFTMEKAFLLMLRMKFIKVINSINYYIILIKIYKGEFLNG